MEQISSYNVYNSANSISKSLNVNCGQNSTKYKFESNRLTNSTIQDKAIISLVAKQLNDLDKYLKAASQPEHNVNEIASPIVNNYIQRLINNYKSPHEIESAYIYGLLNLYNKLIIINQ